MILIVTPAKAEAPLCSTAQLASGIAAFAAMTIGGMCAGETERSA